MIAALAAPAREPGREGTVMADRLYRVVVLWLLLGVVWGVYNGPGSGEDDLLAQVLRTIGCVGAVVVPVAYVIAELAHAFDERWEDRAA
jgi:hypothetical protein